MRSRTLSLSADAVRWVSLTVKNKYRSGHTNHARIMGRRSGLHVLWRDQKLRGASLEHIRGTECFFPLSPQRWPHSAMVELRIQKQETTQCCVSQSQTGIHQPPSQNKAASSCRLPCHFLNHRSTLNAMSCGRKIMAALNEAHLPPVGKQRGRSKAVSVPSTSRLEERADTYYPDASVLNFHGIKLLKKLQATHNSSLVFSFILKLCFAFFFYKEVPGSPSSKVFERNPSWIRRFNSWKFCADLSIQTASIAARQRVMSKCPWQWHQTLSKIFLSWVQSLNAASGCRDSLAV